MDIGQLISAFGTAGLFIWYLITQEQNKTKEIIKNLKNVTESLDDLTMTIFELLDHIIPTEEKRKVREVKANILQRKNEKN